MTKEWVDFKKVKEAVNIQMVLDHYCVTGLHKKGDELRGPCPIHKAGERSKDLTVNLRKNAFKCFSRDCGVRGNVLDFVAGMERCSVRDAALKLQAWFKVGETQSSSEKDAEEIAAKSEVALGIYTDPDGGLFEVITSALSGEDFEPLVVYRELFGDYAFWVAPPQNFGLADCRFTLIKTF